MTKKITDLSAKEAKAFLMDKEQYFNSELPQYFDFSGILSYTATALDGKTIDQCVTAVSPESLDNVNLEILSNKDGRYGVRPLTITNPFLYTFLVNTLCDDDAWQRILKCFEAYNVAHIKACSIPVVRDKDRQESFPQATTILNWWSNMEQTPVELSLRYRYMFVSDISNCFGQVNPESIDWALSRKGTDAATDDNHDLAHNIMRLLKALQGGRNIGIPQGSMVFSFIAEIILGYADMLLAQAIEKAGITEDYTVLRYVDDYRIFCNNRDTLEDISYLLQHVLETLNFRMNVSKTRISDDIVGDALKPDKAFYIFNTPIFNKKGWDFDGFCKHLYFIFQFARKFPNSGQAKVQLKKFYERFEKFHEVDNDIAVADNNAKTDSSTSAKRHKKRQPKVLEKLAPMIAIATQIASDNVAIAQSALSVVSLILSKIDNEDEKEQLIRLVYEKLRGKPNSALLEVWLQNITYQAWIPNVYKYDMPLCRMVYHEDVTLWNNEWIDPAIANGLPCDTICDYQALNESNRIIPISDILQYDDIPDELFDEGDSHSDGYND